MEKRFVLFLVLSAAIILTHLLVQDMLAPKIPVGEKPGDAPAEQTDKAKPGDGKPADSPGEAKPGETKLDEPPAVAEAKPEAEEPLRKVPPRRLTLGSAAADSPFRLLVTLNNQGAAVERIELTQRKPSGTFRFRELDSRQGYLGHLALTNEPGGKGCRVNAVGAGTPAALAKASDPKQRGGLQVGDLITACNGQPIADALACLDFLEKTKPGQSIEIEVRRSVAKSAASAALKFTAQLTDEPLSIIRPEFNLSGTSVSLDPLSCLLTLEKIGDVSVERGGNEIAKLPSLHDSHWEVLELPGANPGVEFRFRLRSSDLKAIGASGSWEIIKRYRLASSGGSDASSTAATDVTKNYHLELELEFHNLGDTPQSLAYRLDGPNGLPLEGWWYSNKLHPRMFHAAGARDVVWNTVKVGHELKGCNEIYKEAREALDEGRAVGSELFASGPEPVDYIGVDTQYFCAVLIPDQSARPATYQQALARPAGRQNELKGLRSKTANSSFRLISQPETVAGKDTKPLTARFTLFAGPKQPDLLAAYGIPQCLEYGWPIFAMVARPLIGILHFFENLPLVNFGIAIILLTALVRGCMFPLSRKAAKNAQMMQELSPEMKRLAEQYKNDMEKRAAAQRELFAKHNYNPFGGCLLMFIQLPIFIGLYRSLAIDVELRQAPLIPGLEWCSNLAGPDMLWNWKNYLFGFFADETGWLGPYLNILPIITIMLFLVQQKMFMPPPTDEQTRMQQQMMKYMMVFMGVMFFKVPSGLCIYFIASSLWGIAERKLLPALPKPGSQPQPAAAKSRFHLPWQTNGNGADKPDVKADRKAREKRRQRKA